MRLRLATASVALVLLAPAAPAVASSVVVASSVGSGQVTVYDAETGAIGPTPGTGGSVAGVAVSPGGSKAYVASSGSPAQLSIVDLASGTVKGAVDLPGAPGGVAVTPDGKTAYVAIESANVVVAIDLATRTISPTTFATGGTPRAIVLSPSGTTAYVADSATDDVAIIDLTGATAPVLVGGGGLDRPEALAITPDGSKVYAASFGTSAGGTKVLPIDTATKTALPSFSAGSTITSVAVDPSGATAYVAARDSDELKVVRTADDTVQRTIPLGGVFPSRLAVTPGGGHLIVTGREVNAVRRYALPEVVQQGNPTIFGGATDVATVPAQGPSAAFAVAGTPTVGAALGFDAAASTDARSLTWAFGDGATATGAQVTHAYGAAGTYTVTLTARGGCAANAVFASPGIVWAGVGPFCNGAPTATATRTVTVPPAPPAAPAAVKPAARVLPLAKGCYSVRDFTVRLKRGLRAKRISVTVDGRRATVVRGKRIRARVNLRGTVKKIVVVKITVTTSTGKRAVSERRYRTCSKKRAGRNTVAF